MKQLIPATASPADNSTPFDGVDHAAVRQGPADLRVGETRCHTVHLQVPTVHHLLIGSLLLLLDLGRSGQNVDPQQNIVVAHLVTCQTQVVTAVLVGHRMNGDGAIGEHLYPGVKTASRRDNSI